MTSFNLPHEDRSINRLLRRHANALADRPFVTIAGKTLSFGETDLRCRSIARGFASRGIGEGSKVAIMLPNCTEFIETWFAATLVGAAAVMINPALKGLLLQNLLQEVRADLIVVHGSDLGTILDLPPDAIPPQIVSVGSESGTDGSHGSKISPFSDLHIAGGPDVSVPDDYRRLQMISYTSGTTGPSKGVMMSNAAAFCAPVNYVRCVGMTPEDRIYAPLPLFHGQARSHGVLSALVMGAPITLDEKFSASRYWIRAAECKASLGMLVTAFTSVLLAQPERATDRQHGLRAMFNVKYNEEFERRFGVRTVTAFAMTEVSHLLNTPFPERKAGSVGRPAPEWEVSLVDANDRPVAVGEPGELICRPRQPSIMMDGYLNKPEITLQSFRNLWFHTGDILRQDEEGYFFFLDRKKDRIRRLGENVSSLEVELQVAAHPAVAECAALPHPEQHGEDDIRVVVVLKPGAVLEAEALHAWLVQKLPKFMVPRYVEIVDAIPRNGTGKIQKHTLLERGLSAGAWDALARSNRAA